MTNDELKTLLRSFVQEQQDALTGELKDMRRGIDRMSTVFEARLSAVEERLSKHDSKLVEAELRTKSASQRAIRAEVNDSHADMKMEALQGEIINMHKTIETHLVKEAWMGDKLLVDSKRLKIAFALVVPMLVAFGEVVKECRTMKHSEPSHMIAPVRSTP